MRTLLSGTPGRTIVQVLLGRSFPPRCAKPFVESDQAKTMCGLVAAFASPGSLLAADAVRLATRRAAHRGPDGEGIVLGAAGRILPDTAADAEWALGHRRLAILDLSPAGLQPMTDRQRQTWIVFNGEVYNYLELADELRRDDFQFVTGTDTEVILAAYRRWGPQCVDRFIGMFALVVVDLLGRRAFAVRDRLGIKPLYYWQHGAGGWWVSEPKQLTGVPGFQARANRQQLTDFVVDSVLEHDPDQCMFDGVRSLPPGHYVTWELGQLPNLSSATCYWNPPRESQKIAWEEAVQQVGDIVSEAVRLRLRSDVPVGAALSGGVDSSTLVGLASRREGYHLHTFSYCEPGTKRDETPYVDAVNQHCQTTPHRFSLNQAAAIDDFEQLIFCQDEPVRQMSQYSEYRLMQLVAENGIKVLLSGQGGDESLCGYRKFAFLFFKQLWHARRYGQAVQHALRSCVSGDGQLFQLRQGLRYAPPWLQRRHERLQQWLRPGYRQLYRRVWQERMRGVQSLHEHQWADLRYWSLPVLLRYLDRNSMAWGIETRVPLVDHRLVELALRLPEPYFFARGRTKLLLIDGVGEVLPPAVRDRRTKLGFDSPQEDWLKDQFGDFLLRRIQGSERFGEVFDKDHALQIFRQYRARPASISHWIPFRLGCLAVWLDRFEVEP